MTHSFAVLEVNGYVFQEIKNKLIEAGYGHALIRSKNGFTIDMHGLALKEEPAPVCKPGWVECHDHNCPDNAPFEGDRVPQAMIHCHEKGKRSKIGDKVRVTVFGERHTGTITGETNEAGFHQFEVAVDTLGIIKRSDKRCTPV